MRPQPLLTLAALLVCATLPAQITFAPAVPVWTGAQGMYVRSGDLDGDGDADVVVSSAHTLSVLWNDGSGAFPSQNILTPGYAVGIPALGDLDGDGDLDIATPTAALGGPFGFSVLLNDGTGGFGPPQHYQTHPQPLSGTLALADLDGDGDLDVVLPCSSNNRIYLHRNNGIGFSTGGELSVPGPQGVAIGDLDGDGDLDVVAAAGGMRVFANLGSWAFAPGVFVSIGPGGGYGPVSVALADLDGDGDLEIAGEIRPLGSNQAPSTMSFVPNLGGLSFGPSSDFPVGISLWDTSAADLNGDGLPELLAVDDTLDRLYVLTNLANGSFGALAAMGTGQGPLSVTTVDLDGDGDLDAVTADSVSLGVSVLFNQTTSTGLPPYPGSNEDLILATGVNGPPMSGLGHYVRTAQPSDSLTVRLNSPAGTFNLLPPFIAAQLFLTGTAPAHWPGYPQVYFDPSSLIVLLNGLNGPFGMILLPPTGVSLSSPAPAGLAGVSALIQGAVFAPTAANGLFAITDGYEIQFL